MLEELKKKYGKVYTLTVPLDEDDAEKKATIYLRKPDRNTRSLMGKLVGGDNAKLIEATLRNLYVGGDNIELIIDNDDALFACDEAIAEMIQVQKASLKKN